MTVRRRYKEEISVWIIYKFGFTNFSSVCLAMTVKFLLNSLGLSENFLTVLFQIWKDVISVFLFIDMLITSVIPSHVLMKFSLFLWI